MDKKLNEATGVFLLSDLHIGSKRVADQDICTGLKNMKTMDPNAVYVINGDLTTSGREMDLDKAWKLIDEIIPANNSKIISLGNHDVRGPDPSSWTNSEEETSTYFENLVIPNYRKNYLSKIKTNTNCLYFSQIVGNCKFIVLNTEKGLKDTVYLSNQQLQWLDKELEFSRNEKLMNLIIIHQPLLNTHWRSELNGGFGQEDVNVKRILSRYPNTFVFSGHIHNGFGICKSIKENFGVCIDLPAYSISENGYIGRGLGYYLQVSDKLLNFQAWDFATGEHLQRYDFSLDV